MEHSKSLPVSDSPSFRSGASGLLNACIDGGLMSADDRIVIDPPTLPRSVMEEGGRATEEVVRLIYSLPRRLFDGSARRMGEACGFPAADIDVMTSNTTGVAQLARSDAYLTPGGWKFTEINIGSSIGGYQIDWAYRALDKGLYGHCLQAASRVDTSSAWCRMVVQEARNRSRGSVPSAAIVDTREHLERFTVWNEGMARELREHGEIDAIACSIESLRIQGDGIYADNRRIDLIYRLFGLSAIVTDTAAYMPLLEAVKSGIVHMITPLDSRIYSNKAVFALLSDPANRHRFTDTERSVIDRHIPPTRLLTEEALAFAHEYRERLVAKPVDGQGGRGVIFGADFSPSGWLETLHKLMAEGHPHVLQEQIFPSDGTNLVWSRIRGFQRSEFSHLYGIFTVDSRYAGINLRATPADGTKVLQYSAESYTAPVYPV